MDHILLQQVNERYLTLPPIPDTSLMLLPLSPGETNGLANPLHDLNLETFCYLTMYYTVFNHFHFIYRGSQLGMDAGKPRMLHVYWSVKRLKVVNPF